MVKVLFLVFYAEKEIKMKLSITSSFESVELRAAKLKLD